MNGTGCDFHQDLAARFGLMCPVAFLNKLTFLIGADRMYEALNFPFWADVFQRHPQKLGLRVAVILDGGKIDSEKGQGSRVVNPHGKWIGFEEETIALFGL